ncbi:MAG TPA: hypothetical protein VG276_27945 [Actinomycetes bacterium]|nr:hypothetical protein [Actinomycetes bacterium]
MADVYPYLAPGDPVTLDLVTGASGITGKVVAVDLTDDGSLRCLSIIDDPGRSDPLRIRGDLVALWRRGEPVRRTVPQGIAVPAGNLEQIRAALPGQPNGMQGGRQ